MGKSARVGSIEVMREVKAALRQFEAAARAALSEVEADVQRTGDWLRMQQLPYWQKEIRKRSEEIAQRRSDLLRKQLSSMQDSPSAIDERKALEKAKRRHQEAQDKLQAVRKWMTIWDREATLYKGQTQGLQDAITRDVPDSYARLDKMADALAKYVSIAPARVDADSGAVSEGGGGEWTMPPPDENAPTAAERFARLRRRTPQAEARLRALIDKPELALTEGAPILPEALEILARLGLGGAAPSPQSLVLIEVGALRQAEVYLEHSAPVAPIDSGWFIGFSQGGPTAGECAAVTVAALLAKRPDLGPALILRPGCLVAVVAGGIEAVLDESDRDAWEAWR